MRIGLGRNPQQARGTQNVPRLPLPRLPAEFNRERWTTERLVTAAGLALLLALVLAGCSRRGLPGSNRPIYKLSNDFEPLRAQFNRDADKVRVLLLLDPT